MVPRPLEICTGRCARPQPLQQGAFEFRSGRFAEVFNFAQTRLPCLAHGSRGLDRIAVSKTTERREGGIMKTQADYRKLAEDCVRLAQTAKETHRAMLLNMANTWLQFADQLARDHQWMANGRGRA